MVYIYFQSLFFLIVGVGLVSGLGFCIRKLFKLETLNKFQLFEFENNLIGIFVAVLIYTFFKSPVILNSITVSTIAVFIIISFFRKPFAVNNKNYLTESNLWIGGVLLLVIYTLKFLYHFRVDLIDTGYGDLAWYNNVAKSLQLTGIETVDIHVKNLSPGIIYHYWDLWALSLTFSLTEPMGVSNFESNLLILQPFLIFVIASGFLSIINRVYYVLFLSNIKTGILLLLILVAIFHGFGELGIFHHSKQFIPFAIVILITIRLSNPSWNIHENNFFIYIPVLLFYSVLSGSAIILSIYLFFLIYSKKKKMNEIINIFLIGVTTLLLFYFYYFIYCNNSETAFASMSMNWSIWGVLNRFFVYHVYHNLFSFVGVVIYFNTFLVFGFIIMKRERFLKFDILNKIPIVLIKIISYLILLFWGSIVLASIFYNVQQDFQFYNTNYIIVSILLVCNLFLLQMFFPTKKILGFAMALIIGVSGILKIYLNQAVYYNTVKINFDDYTFIKNIKAPEQVFVREFGLYDIEDIIFSFANVMVKRNCDLRNPNSIKIHKQSANQVIYLTKPNFNEMNNCKEVYIELLGQKRSIYINTTSH